MFIKSVLPIFLLFSFGGVKAGFFGCWGEFDCANGNCVSYSVICDGSDDCGDRSDEKSCGGHDRMNVLESTIIKDETTGTVSPKRVTVDLSSPSHNITVRPDSQLFVQCRDHNFGKSVLNWYKPDGQLPFGSSVRDGLLVIPTVGCEDGGTYICYRVDQVNIYHDHTVLDVEVDQKFCLNNPRSTSFTPITSITPTWKNTFPRTLYTMPQTFSSTNGYSYTMPCGNGMDCYQFCCNGTCATVVGLPDGKFRCEEGSYVSVSSICNGVKDCPDESDERSCGNSCLPNEFRCGDGTCIPEIQKCDGEFDCIDGTDESKCGGFLRPKLIQHPGTGVEIDCIDPDSKVKGPQVLQLECKFFGRPLPVVKWKKNLGHIPSKCVSHSKFGHGSLICPNFEQSDQGTYSCVGENSIGSAESQPETVVKCKTITCENGFRVSEEHNVESCLKCYCSGRTTSCHGLSSKVITTSFAFPTTQVDMVSNANGEIFLPNSSNMDSYTLKRIKYCLVPEEKVQSHKFMMSYGRNLNLPAVNKMTGFMPSAPDVVITGRGVMLKYSVNSIAQNSTTMNVRFWNDNWQHSDGSHASRIDIMSVLSHLEQIYIRCEYQEGLVKTDPFATIKLESAVISDESDAVSYIEKCSCPTGYDGLSCELCAPGYERDPGSDTCVPRQVAPRICPHGMTGNQCDQCDIMQKYYRHKKSGTCVKSTCNEMGSIGVFPDDYDNCLCKEGVTGRDCDTCKFGYFHLDKENPIGCKKCWCNNVTRKCESSNFQRTAISSSISAWGGFNESSGGNYWLLPTEFRGNLVTSYGGTISCTIQYQSNTEDKSKPLAVEILSESGVTIRYVINFVPTETKSWSIPIEEPFWRDSSNSVVSRDKLLFVLSQVKAIFIESPCPLSSGKVKLTNIELEIAEVESNEVFSLFGSERAWKVEICDCPIGYEGTSCETCSVGYYRQRNSLEGYSCEKCNCDIKYCDSLHGCAVCPKGKYNNNTDPSDHPVCLECPCNGNEEYCEKDDYNLPMCFCKPGYHGAKCEIEENKDDGDFQVWLFPITVLKNVGASITFNCSYLSKEEHRIKFQKNYSKNPPWIQSGLFKVENYGWSSTLETNIEQDLVSVDCIIRTISDEVVARITSKIIKTGTNQSKPIITNCYDEPKIVTENEDTYLRCDVNGSPTPEVTWHKVEKTGELVQLNSTDGIHTIPSVGLAMNGTTFSCLAENSLGRAECTTLLIVKKRCVLSIQPANPVVLEGEPIEFYCTTETGSTVSWSRTNDLIPEEAIVNEGTLIIPNVELRHMGEYKCTANDPSGPSVKTTRLTVKRRRIPPSAMIRQSDMITTAGSFFNIDCVVTGDPEPTVVWSKMGESALPENVRVSMDGLTLHFDNVELRNTGFYQCRAESFLNSTSRILITVLEIPEIMIEPEYVVAKVNDTVEIDCISIKGNPLTKFTWSKYGFLSNFEDSPELHLSGKLRFPNIQVNDAGKYVCLAENEVGETRRLAMITVGDVPKLELVPNGTIDVVPMDQVDLECRVGGDAVIFAEWLIYYKAEGFKNSFQKSVEVINHHRTNDYLTLTITDDMDSVVCRANNSFGIVNSTLFFNVKPQKPTISGVSKRVLLGTRVELDFSPLGGKINCTRLTESMIGDECYIPNGLEIMNAQVQHTGTYKCSSNSREMSYTIKVHGFVNRFRKDHFSFLVLPLRVKSRNDFNVEITFKAERYSGILLVKKKHHAFLMYLKRGKLNVRLRRHSEEITLTTKNNVQLFVWYTAVFRLRNTAELTVYDEEGLITEKVTDAKKFEMSWMINAEDNLYLGGVKLSERHLPLSPVDAYFEGCVSRLIVDDHEYKITEEGILSKNVSLCNVCGSGENPCGRDGVCFDAPTHYGFACVCGKDNCPANCKGLACQSKFNPCELIEPCGYTENRCLPYRGGMKCHCANGYSGLTCHEEIEFQFSLNGNGFIQLPETYLPRNSMQEPEVIKILFTLDGRFDNQKMVLFGQGDSSDYLEIYLEYDHVVYVYNNQNEKLKLSGSIDISNQRHNVEVTRHNNTAELKINGDSYLEKASFKTNRVHGNIYIGGLPEQLHVTSHGFSGCIHHVSINGKKINTLAEDVIRRNIHRSCTVDTLSFTGMSEDDISSNDEEDEVEDDDDSANSKDDDFIT